MALIIDRSWRWSAWTKGRRLIDAAPRISWVALNGETGLVMPGESEEAGGVTRIPAGVGLPGGAAGRPKPIAFFLRSSSARNTSASALSSASSCCRARAG